MKKVIIINHEPLTSKIKHNFFIEDMIKKDYYVEFWCVRNIIHKKVVNYFSEERPYYYKEIESLDSLKNEINKIKNQNDLKIIIELPMKYNSIKIYKNLCDITKEIYVFEMYATANLSEKDSFRKNMFKILDFRNLFYRLKRKVEFKYISKYLDNNFNINKFVCGNINNSNEIGINHFDYEEYIKNRKNEGLIKNKYCLFLDQYLPNHPDFKLNNTKVINENTYYKKMNILFEKITNQYGLEVIIASHPKADYTNNVYFKNFKCIQNNTNLLVRDCEFVILHDSLALNYAIIYEKPMMLVYMNEFYKMNTSHMKRINYLSKALNLNAYNIDSYKGKFEPKTNLDRYRKYKYNYLVNNKNEYKTNIEIISKYI